jgi:HPt (histidine-containing phosphotransfer) domain-containing protein
MKADLGEIWERARPILLARVAVVERATAGLGDGSASQAAVAAGRSEAHKLAGVLGTFGLGRGTELARELERRLEKPEPDDAIPLERLAAELRRVVSQGPP